LRDSALPTVIHSPAMPIAVEQLLTAEINRPARYPGNTLETAHQVDRQLSITNPETRSNSS